MNSVTFWHLGHSLPVSGGGGGSDVVGETIIEITTTRPNQLFAWGAVEGSVNYYDWNGIVNNDSSYVFKEVGTYIIKLVGNISHFSASSSLVTNIIKVSNTVTTFEDSFAFCSNLRSIPEGLFDQNVNVTSFKSCFASCTSLTSIPVGLFDKNVNVTDFSGCFNFCESLASIPAGLFDKNVNVTDFSRCFVSCSKLTSLPVGLFDKNVNVTDFSYCFNSCYRLVAIHDGFFDKNVNVVSFKNCFSFCSAFYSVPVGLFDKNTGVTDFSFCFAYCSNLTNRPKPNGLEMWQIAGTNGRPDSIDFTGLFMNCLRLPDYNSLPSSVK